VLGSSWPHGGWFRRLRSFRALHSDIEIDFVPVESEAVGEPSLDVRILWTTRRSPRHVIAASLFRERVFPSALRRYFRAVGHCRPGGAADLPLIQKRHHPIG